MGKFHLKLPRTALAFVLTALAIAVPCAAWFVAGRGEVERASGAEARALRQKAQSKAEQLAERLAERLENLRQSENRRPFYHYQNLYHDPNGAAEGASVSISPLALGPPTPWIAAHFQIDDEGRLRLPTVNDQFPDLGLPADSSQCALLTGLEEIALLCSSAFGAPKGYSCNERLDPLLQRDPAALEQETGAQRVVLARGAWWQHLQANALYADIREQRKTVLPDRIVGGRGAAEQIRIDVGPFLWHTLPVGDTPSLVALRDVRTPNGLWAQGFVVDRDSIEHTLLDAPYRASFVPATDASRRPSSAVAVVDGTPWAVVLDLSAELEALAGATSERRERFLRLFLFGTLAAGLAGSLVVSLVYQAERLAEQRSRFAANAAHELRTPLAGLRLYGEMLAEGLGQPANARLYARRMASEAERLGRVVTNVLGFTRLERHVLNVQPELGDLRVAVTETLERHRPALEEAEVELVIELEDGLPAVCFDRDAIAQILQNLLDNAEKYTRGIEDRHVVVRLERRGDQVELTVADNGRGVGRQVRKRLFRPFERGGEQDAPEGLGLGLVLVKALVTAQGGTISYRDAPDGGAMFTVSLPRPAA